MKLKILHLTQFLGVGGLEKVLFLLINEQLKAGHEVVLVVYDYEQAWVEDFRKSGITVDTTFKKGPGYDLKLLMHIHKYAKSFDIIHTHDLNPLMYAAPAKFMSFALLKNFPKLIHTAHGMDHLHKRPITKLYEKLCALMTNYTVGVSTAVCDYYLKLGTSKTKVININNGTQVVDIDPVERKLAKERIISTFNLVAGRKIWVCVARIVPLKDQKIICELAKRLPEMDFLLIGPSGNEEYWNELQKDKPTNVIMPGGRSDITQILLGSDYFISASTHEGIPVSVLEAGAVTLPCLLSNIPGHQVIQNGCRETIALYFNVGDLDSLYEKAKLLSSDTSVVTSIASALHNHVKDNFSSTTMYKRYLDVYLGLNVSQT